MIQIINKVPCTIYTTQNQQIGIDANKVVTVSVLTYNSVKYVLETLDSIKEQTYPYLSLQISDDCSTDGTIELCRKWIETNRDRFVKTKIIVPEHNTGTSENANRAWDACETIYFKGIGGDDILLSNCVEDNMNYVKEHPDAVFVFSEIESFGDDSAQVNIINNQFDYTYFNLDSEDQLQILESGSNFIPASSGFDNMAKVREYGIRHDERIPLLEDMPKWINALKKGIVLQFFPRRTVKYRVHESSLSTSIFPSTNFVRSMQLFLIYYVYLPIWNQSSDRAASLAVSHYMELYEQYKKALGMYNGVIQSHSYKIGRKIIAPLRWIKTLCRLRKA